MIPKVGFFYWLMKCFKYFFYIILFNILIYVLIYLYFVYISYHNYSSDLFNEEQKMIEMIENA